MISGLQIRAARGFLAWDRRDLAKKAVVTIYVIERIETGAKISGTAMVKGLAAIQAALEAEGIEFADDKGVLGVRLHPKKRKGK
jgi:ribosome-binding protein aMBF1 (putative translation factor)